MNKEDKEDKENTEENQELKATCRQCGFSAHPEKFDACFSVYHDLRCPECGTTDVDWTYGKYKDNSLIMN